MSGEVTEERIEKCLLIMAKHMERDPIYEPIFIRLENELAALRAKGPTALERARALLAQNGATA